MGCGDWNDGMNLVGQHGKGESVWLAFFLYENLNQFAALARLRGDFDFAGHCETEAMVHRFGQLDVSFDRRITPGDSPGSRQAPSDPVSACRLEVFQTSRSLSRNRLPHHGPVARAIQFCQIRDCRWCPADGPHDSTSG